MRNSWMARVAAGAALAALAACGPQGPAGGGPAPGDSAYVRRAAGDAPPVTGIIGYRERLALTSAQVVTLDSLGEALRVRNEPLRRRLTELRDSFGGRNGRMTSSARDRFAELGQPLLDELRTNNQRAAAEVHEVLTPAQRLTVCELFQPRPGDGRRRGRAPGGRQGIAYPGAPGGGPTGGGGRQVRADSIGMRPETALFWCPRPNPRGDSAAMRRRPPR